MKIKATFLVLRNKESNAVWEVQSLGDSYDEVGISYPKELFSREALEEWLISVWGKDRYIVNGADLLQQYASKDTVYIQSEARHLPSLGDAKVSIEEHEVEIN